MGPYLDLNSSPYVGGGGIRHDQTTHIKHSRIHNIEKAYNSYIYYEVNKIGHYIVLSVMFVIVKDGGHYIWSGSIHSCSKQNIARVDRS